MLRNKCKIYYGYTTCQQRNSKERFIYDGQGNYKTSMMSNWIERVLEARLKNKIDPNNKLMK